LSPFAKPFVPKGRSKAQRWVESSPLSSTSGSSLDAHGAPAPEFAGPPKEKSFKDALLSGADRAASPAQPVQEQPGPTKIVNIRKEGRVSSTPRRGPDEDGWQMVEHRQARRRRQAQHVPRRQIPADLRGKCFNCLSASHRAAVCRRPTRCFQCMEPGHRISRCPVEAQARRSVWERLIPPDVSSRPRLPVWLRVKLPSRGRLPVWQRISGVSVQKDKRKPGNEPGRIPVWRRIDNQPATQESAANPSPDGVRASVEEEGISARHGRKWRRRPRRKRPAASRDQALISLRGLGMSRKTIRRRRLRWHHQLL
jgi:hypothetical protein